MEGHFTPSKDLRGGSGPPHSYVPAGEPWEPLSQDPRTVIPAPSLGLVPPCTFLSLGGGHTEQCSGLTAPVSVLRGLNSDWPHTRQVPFPLCSLPAPPLLLQPLSGLPCWDWGGGCCWGLWLPQEHPLQPILGHAGKGPTLEILWTLTQTLCMQVHHSHSWL